MQRPSSVRRQDLGRESERLAAGWLASRGYQLEAANVRCAGGELDLVARDGTALCFIEVRSTTSDQWGGPLATIDLRKRRQIIRAARWFLAARRPAFEQIRFDVVAVIWRGASPPAFELVQGAFDAGGAW